MPAHYCIPELSEDPYPDCQSNNPAYNPYAVPMPKDTDGNYRGTEDREHKKLILAGNPDFVSVDIGSYTRRCAICGCEYATGSGHSNNGTATIYRETDGLKVAPRSLSTNGFFTVKARGPSTDYGDDVFTYQVGSWYNRGRYTVLGLSNYLAYSKGPVTNAPYSRVAVGVTNSLVFWTGVDLPSGDLSITLSGDGKAQLVAYNRASNRYDVLISPPATNYTSTIVDWRNKYRNPTTRYVQAYLMPLTNGLCTLTQSFAGEGNGLSVSHSALQIFSIHTFTAEPITSETDSDGYVYNPSGIPVGGKFTENL